MSYISTIVLYIFIFLISTLFAIASQRGIAFASDRKTGLIVQKCKTNLLLFFLSFIIPWFFISFTNIGVDYKSYYDMAQILTWQTITKYSGLEVGFNFVLLLLKSISRSNLHIVLFLLKTITISSFFICFYCLRDKLRLGYSVLGYLMLIYLPSFFLLAQCLASAIVMVAVTLYIRKKKIVLPFIILLIATQIHNSCFLVLPCFVLIAILSKHKNYSIFALGALSLVYLFAVIFAKPIYSLAQRSIPGFHYNYYGSNDWNGSGLLVFVMYIPLIIIFLLLRKKRQERFLMVSLLAFILTSLFFRILSYIFVVIERVEFLLSFIYMVLIPIALFKTYKNKNIYFNNLSITGFVIGAYFMFRGILIFNDFVLPRTGLASYQFFNPFS